MADLVLYILISLACFLGLLSILYQVFLQMKKKSQSSIYQEQMRYAIDQTTREMQKFFDLLQMRPSSKGLFGENIIEILLTNLPKNCIKKQYEPADIPGRIDFTIQLPQSDILIPLDSKFILPKNFENKADLHLDTYAIDHLNKKTLQRAKEITKYVQSAETTDFVLMFLPDFVYGLLDSKTFQKLAALKVVPTNTSGLLSTIFMINMQYRFTKLNKAANSFGAIQLQVCEGLQEIIEKMQTGTKQLHYSMNNFSDVTNDLQTIQYKLESLEIEHYPKNKR